jgi:uncharacterized protein (TIGR03067 family)
MFRRASLVALCIPFLSGLAVAVQDTATDTDKKALQGKWEIISSIHDGKEMDQKGKMHFFIFSGDSLESTGPKGRVTPYTLDASKTPKALNISSDVEMLCIYELKGDDLKLCGHFTKRPTEFVSTDKNQQYVLVLKRVKK